MFCLAGNAYAAEVWNSNVPVDTILSTGNCTATEQGVSNVCDYTYGFDGYDNVTGAVNVEVVRTYVDCDPLDAPSFDGYLTVYDRTAAAIVATSDLTEITCNNPAANTTYEPAGTDYYFSSPFTIPSGNDIELIWSLDGTVDNIQIGYQVALFPGAYGFRMYDSPPAPPDPELTFYFPGNSTASTSIPDFTNWAISLSDADPVGVLRIVYSRSSSSLAFSGANNAFVDQSVPGQLINPWTRVFKRNSLGSGVWFAKAYYSPLSNLLSIYSSDVQRFSILPFANEPVFTSSTILFNPLFPALGTGVGYSVSSTASSTASPFYVNCDAYTLGLFSSTSLPGIGCIVKKVTFEVFEWLFIPGSTLIEQFISLIDITNYFPFSLVKEAVTLAQSTIENSMTSTTVYSATTLSIPQIGLSTQLLSSSTLKDALVNPNCDNACANSLTENIFDAERAIIWIGTVIGVITMIF